MINFRKKDGIKLSEHIYINTYNDLDFNLDAEDEGEVLVQASGLVVASGYKIGTEESTGSENVLATEAAVANELASANFSDQFNKMSTLEEGTYNTGDYLVSTDDGNATAVSTTLATEEFVEEAVSDAVFHTMNQKIVLHEDRTEGANPKGRDDVVPSESYILKSLVWHTSVN